MIGSSGRFAPHDRTRCGSRTSLTSRLSRALSTWPSSSTCFRPTPHRLARVVVDAQGLHARRAGAGVVRTPAGRVRRAGSPLGSRSAVRQHPLHRALGRGRHRALPDAWSACIRLAWCPREPQGVCMSAASSDGISDASQRAGRQARQQGGSLLTKHRSHPVLLE